MYYGVFVDNKSDIRKIQDYVQNSMKLITEQFKEKRDRPAQVCYTNFDQKMRYPKNFHVVTYFVWHDPELTKTPYYRNFKLD